MPLADGVTLQPQQERVTGQAQVAASTGEPFRKLLLWQMGSGKTPGAVAATDALGVPATAVVPAALRKNYQGAVQQFAPDGPPTEVLSYSQIARGKTPHPDSQTLTFDEAQRLGSPGSAQAAAGLRLARQAKNVILMTGTPAKNDPSEFAPLFEMLTGQSAPPDQFRRRYVKEETTYPGGLVGRILGREPVTREVIDHPEELASLLAGKVDVYKPDAPPVGVTHEDVEAELTKPQARLYEAMYGRLPWVLRWKLRRNYPLTGAELNRARSFLTGPRQVALSTLPYMKRPDPLAAFRESGKLQTAFSRMKENLDSHPDTKGIVYSNFVRAGLDPYSAALAHAGVPHAVFHGGLTDEERRRLVADFNEGKTRVALVGPSGAEGVSFRGAQLTQILDEAFNHARTDQAAARGVRFDSHGHLPPELQRMKVERYVGRLPLGVRARVMAAVGLGEDGARSTADDYLRRLSDQKRQLTDQLLDVLRRASELPTPQKQGEARPLAVVVTGNPAYVRGNPAADAFYADVSGHLRGLGYDVATDPGEPHTVPPPAAVWVGHSRGADRLPFAPPGTVAVPIGSARDGAINHPADPVHLPAGSYTPGPEHYTFTPEMADALTARLRPRAEAATPLPPGAAYNFPSAVASLRQAKALSDQRRYGEKAEIVRSVIRRNPDAWVIDSRPTLGIVGLTHSSGFKIHLPAHAVSEFRLKSAISSVANPT